ncbi:Ig-like domain-containing protein [Paenibacillus allorhizosphaerae]|uniref:BIG2 domain-containing protein n=1 Tax=Paenibacillus allorhizosphaerae TaxID=2849866 RepID=A0ABM8VE07_9BACL|nr:Ig-like domain-containing protein [Paenibacillus allorhizosphaerae]CAG7627460.1 hypothetical protein PAECIP111802_01356 [Paenibacillus allorhizosphaerae]
MLNKSFFLLCISILFVLGAGGFGMISIVKESNAEPIIPNIVVNGGFESYKSSSSDGWTERRPDGWKIVNLTGAAKATVDLDAKHDGTAALQLQGDSKPTRSAVSQNVSVHENQYYEASAWVKTDQLVSNDAGATFRLQFYNTANANMNKHITFGSVKGTEDWMLVTHRFQAPAGATKMLLEIFIWNSTGTAWFDEVALREVTPVADIVLDRRTAALRIGEKLAIGATVLPEQAGNKRLTWISSNPDVAQVQDGIVIGIGSGSARITTQSVDSGVKTEIAVEVSADGGSLKDDNYSHRVKEDQQVNGAMAVKDAEGNSLSYAMLDFPRNGAIRLDLTGTWSYTPNADFAGTDKFIAVVTNGKGGIASSEVTINIIPENDPPKAENEQKQTLKNTSLKAKISGYDVDGDSLTYSVALPPSHGTVTLGANDDWTYVPATDYLGADMFTLSVQDGNGGNTETEVSLLVTPPRTDVIVKLKKNSAGQQHPRLMATADDFSRIREGVETDANMKKWYNNLIVEADAILPQPVSKYELPDGRRLLDTSRRVLSRVRTLAMTYQISGDEKYAERAWMELDAAAGFKDWNPSHFLDTAEMTHAFAIGYDWLYHYWTPERKEVLRTAIVEKGLKQALGEYRKQSDWSKANHNWNSVCNGGIGIGALAIADENPELEALAGEILEGAIKLLPTMIAEYAPDGAWGEGPGYWEYGTQYAVYFLESLHKTLGMDYGITDMKGFPNAFRFLIHINGPKGTFNFADGGAGKINSPLALWFALRFGQQDAIWYHQNLYNADRGGLFDLLWYRPDAYASSADGDVPSRDAYFRHVENVVMRSAWNQDDAAFAAFKAGDNSINHGHLDIGTFVYDVLGIRWAHDLGADNYNLPDYFQKNRWQYYRTRAEGHNTLVINPGKEADQSLEAKAAIVKFDSNAYGAMAIGDLTSAYKQDAISAKRGMMMFDSRRQLLIQDELRLRKPSEVWWFMHTQAQIDVLPDGKSAILSQAGKRVMVQLLGETGASFSVMNAEPLPTSPGPKQGVNNRYKKLTIHLSGVETAVLSVRFVPLLDENADPNEPIVTPLDQWTLSE